MCSRIYQLVISICFTSFTVFGGTFYLSPSGSDSNNCTAAQSSTKPKATFSSAWSCLNPGDTLELADGTYSTASPPSGKSGFTGNPITITAANNGKVVISSGLTLKNNSYLVFEGMRFAGSDSAANIVSGGTGQVSHHVTFKEVAFSCTTFGDNSCVILSDGTHHVLIEDSWVWGGGRYMILVYGGPGGSPPNTTADYNTIRRVVIRQGPSKSQSGNPQAGLALYYASNNIVENVIVLDSQPSSNSSNSAFYLTTHAAPPSVSTNKFYGVLALNNLGVGWYLDHDGTGSKNELRNSVIWGSTGGGVYLYSAGSCSGNIIDHITSGANGGSEGGIWNYCDSTAVKSSISINNSTYGLKQGGKGSLASANWNALYGNKSGAYMNVSPGSNDKTSNPSLKYIARVETGTPCSAGGEGGTNCGADLSKRYQDGSLGGTALWPWPNEARIKKDMCTDAGITRGFCSKASLTEYVWTYLGNPVPPEIKTGTSPGATSPCDLDGSGAVTQTDVHTAIDKALQVATCTSKDLAISGACNVVYVQRVVNASLGGACRTGQ